MADDRLRLRIGPATFEFESGFRGIMRAAREVYRDYPKPGPDEIIDFSVRARAINPWRCFVRPALEYTADYWLQDVPPLPARLGVLGFEMAANVQIALGYRRQAVIHASSSETDGKALLMTGESGSGKSTLSALLAYARGWRHLGDEIALLTTDDDPHLLPYPRPISLKNESIPVLRALAPADRFGPLMERTVKGTVQHLLPPVSAIDAMDTPARPALILNPRFTPGTKPRWLPLSPSAAFTRLSMSSTNHLLLGERGFLAFVRLVGRVPAYDIEFGSTADGLALVDELWARHA